MGYGLRWKLSPFEVGRTLCKLEVHTDLGAEMSSYLQQLSIPNQATRHQSAWYALSLLKLAVTRAWSCLSYSPSQRQRTPSPIPIITTPITSTNINESPRRNNSLSSSPLIDRIISTISPAR